MVEQYYLERRSSWYNPFYVGKWVLNNINFYTPHGIIVSTGEGWFSDERCVRVDSVDIGPIVRKKTIDFTFPEPYIVSVKSEYIHRNELRADLYIPYIEREWTVETKIERGYSPRYDQEIIVYRNTRGFVITKFERRIPIDENNEYLDGLIELFNVIGIDQPERLYGEQNFIKNKNAAIAAMRAFIERFGTPRVPEGMERVYLIRRDIAEWDDIDIYVDEYHVKPDVNLVDALHDAANEYVGTPDGSHYYESTNECFNYGDAIDIPNEITTKHGFAFVRTIQGGRPGGIEVDHNTHLIDD